MQDRKEYKFLVFLTLIGVVFLFRETLNGSLPFVISTAAVILFWYFHGMKFAINGVRTILILLAGFSLIFYAFGDRIGFSSTKGYSSGRLGADLNPAMISELKASHEIALELYLDHSPSEEDRYYKTGTFTQTENGLRYSAQKTALDSARLPKSQAWVDKNLKTTSVKAAAAAIEKWWSEGFSYSLSPGKFSGAQPMDEFLFERKIGFCEHYAAALATLLKLKGFESRVAVGYAEGSWNPVLKKLTYEDADAHAWVEARDRGYMTWIRLDPTLWVSPTENLRRPDLSTAWTIGLVLICLLAAFVGVRLWRRDPRERFFKKLERLERRNQLSAVGLTVGERIEGVIARQAYMKDSLQKTLLQYQNTYFADEPKLPSIRKFSQSLREW